MTRDMPGVFAYWNNKKEPGALRAWLFLQDMRN
jgi:hypothetical protein